MSSELSSLLRECIQQMLKPVIRFALKRAVGLQEFIESAKQVYVEVAADQIKKSGQKINLSRLSTLSGVHRRDVTRIFREGEVKEESTRFASRVIGQWRRDKRFLDSSGKPRVLSYRTEDSEFTRLVNHVSKDLHARSILFALEQVGAVKITPNGVKLTARTYEPKKNVREAFRMLARDADELIGAVVDNAMHDGPEPPNFHSYTFFDNISAEDLDKIKSWLYKHCAASHSRVERYLSKFDLDVTPSAKKKGGMRVAMGSFTRIGNPEEL